MVAGGGGQGPMRRGSLAGRLTRQLPQRPESRPTRDLGVWDLASLLVLSANPLAFMVIEMLLFWFVASKAIDIVVRDKAELVALLAESNGLAQEVVSASIDGELGTTVIPAAAAAAKERRVAANLELTKLFIAPAVIVCASLCVLCLLAMRNRRQPLTLIDNFLLRRSWPRSPRISAFILRCRDSSTTSGIRR